MQTPREVFLEARVAELERELALYRDGYKRGDRDTTILAGWPVEVRDMPFDHPDTMTVRKRARFLIHENQYAVPVMVGRSIGTDRTAEITLYCTPHPLCDGVNALGILYQRGIVELAGLYEKPGGRGG